MSTEKWWSWSSGASSFVCEYGDNTQLHGLSNAPLEGPHLVAEKVTPYSCPYTFLEGNRSMAFFFLLILQGLLG